MLESLILYLCRTEIPSLTQYSALIDEDILHIKGNGGNIRSEIKIYMDKGEMEESKIAKKLKLLVLFE